MKKLLLLVSMAIIVLTSNSQIVKEHEYDNSANLVKLALSGDKYYAMDWTNNKCLIYNMDHSIWKSINLAIPVGQYLYDIRHVSETLFNLDTKIELAYIYYLYDTTYYYYTYTERVINEDGLELLSVPGSGYSEVHATSGSGTKLLLWVYDYSLVPYTVGTSVYSIPGQPVSDGNEQANTHEKTAQAYPNPANGSFTIPYRLPAGITTGEIYIMNAMGVIVRTFRVGDDFSDLKVVTDGWPRGAFFYKVKAGAEFLSSGKIIIE